MRRDSDGSGGAQADIWSKRLSAVSRDAYRGGQGGLRSRGLSQQRREQSAGFAGRERALPRKP